MFPCLFAGCVIGFSVTVAVLIVGCVASNVLVGFTCRHITQRMEHSTLAKPLEEVPLASNAKPLKFSIYHKIIFLYQINRWLALNRHQLQGGLSPY